MNVNPETQVAYLAEALTLTTLQALANVDALMSQKPPTHAAAKLRHCAKTLGDLDQTANQTKINTHLLGEQLAVELIILKQRKLSLIQDINACQTTTFNNLEELWSEISSTDALHRPQEAAQLESMLAEENKLRDERAAALDIVEKELTTMTHTLAKYKLATQKILPTICPVADSIKEAVDEITERIAPLLE